MSPETTPLTKTAVAAAPSFSLPWASLVELGRARAESFGEQPLYTFLPDPPGEDEGHLSFAGLDLRARAIGAALQRLGAGGQRALLLYPPGLEFVAAFFGCLYAGVVAVPAYPPRSARTLPRLLEIARDARPAVALTTTELKAAIGGLATQVPDLSALRLMATNEVPLEQAGDWSDPGATGSTMAFLQYTSGSTAAPKGVMVTHGNLLHNEEMIRQAFGQTADSVIVGWLPLYHDMGLIGNVMQPLYLGARCVLMSPIAFLQSPKRWLAAISLYRATTSGGPNFAYDLCVRKISAADRASLDLSSWDTAFNGAEPVRAETMARFAEAFGGSGFQARAFFPCYGLAEATLFVSGGAGAGALRGEPRVAAFDRGLLEAGEACPPKAAGDPASRVLVSCGRAWLGQDLAIVDPETLTRCDDRKVGEIWVRGLSVAQGYWHRPVETAETFAGRLAEPAAGPEGAGDGEQEAAPFLRTGDLGFLDGGELFVTGRLKDLIIIRGRNLYPQDVELTVERSHPGLRPGCGAAFSVEIGDEERLVVVHEHERTADDAPLDPGSVEAIADAVRQAVAEQHAAQVQQVVLLRAGTIPKTSSGKIQRRACRAALLAGRLVVIGASALGGPAAAAQTPPAGAPGPVNRG
ncbi:MAG TPA: fatty acyl-AMP ligase [Thermoanaerobaculia bacterium]|nr:fatty acyl-AMP ligase [Thermoanaerobaculia bacterium]